VSVVMAPDLMILLKSAAWRVLRPLTQIAGAVK
jgi:hypothetical protein